MTDLDTLREFLLLPLADSSPLLAKFASLPGATLHGRHLERFLWVPGTRPDRVLLVAHADTVWDARYAGEKAPRQELVEANGILRNRHGGLGADDRAGCALLWLLRDLGHSLLITDGEETGRLGSHWLMAHRPEIAAEINQRHQFALQFDRRHGRDFKCYSVGTDVFRAYLRQTTGYREPDRLSFTDIVTLCTGICGANLSVGYDGEHTEDESLVVAEWAHTLQLCRHWLAQPGLPRFPLPPG